MSRWGSIRDELQSLLSPECFAQLVERFGNRTIRVPSPTVLAQLRRRAREREMIDGGDSYRAVADALGVAPSTVVRDMKRSTGNT